MPGDLESAPSFLRKSMDECLYEFEWRTAAACPLGHKWGKDCRVFDDDAGEFVGAESSALTALRPLF